MKVSHWRSRLAESLPFYYGWVIIANTVAISLSSRTIMTVAVLSVFVVPMTEELGWSRGLFSGAVSLGGLCAVVISPFIGRWVDRYGAGTLLAVSSFLTGALSVLLAMITSPLAFYALYVPGRMIFTGPLELGIPTALSNWFIRRRPLSRTIAKSGKEVYKDREVRYGSVWIWKRRNLCSSVWSRCRTPGGPGESGIPFRLFCG